MRIATSLRRLPLVDRLFAATIIHQRLQNKERNTRSLPQFLQLRLPTMACPITVTKFVGTVSLGLLTVCARPPS